MTQVTQRTEPATLGDLLDRASRAALAFTKNGRPEIIPVRFLSYEDRYWVGLTSEAAATLPVGTSVTLVVDDGCWWFDLRAVQVRGVVADGSPPEGGSSPLHWLEVLPSSVSAWDYGRLHE